LQGWIDKNQSWPSPRYFLEEVVICITATLIRYVHHFSEETVMGSTVGDTGRGLVQAQISPMHQVVDAMAQFATSQAQQVSLRQLQEIQKQIYEHASAYSKVILGMGYAGAFGIWAATRQYLSASQAVLIALGLCASLFCYVAFEVYQTIYQGIVVGQFINVVNAQPAKIGEAVQEFQRRYAKHSPGFMRLWQITTFLAITFAMFALIILFYAFIANLVSIWR
jgi:hypothetical protein